MDKETGAQVQADGEAVRAAAEFTPDGPDGTVELSFRISGQALAGKTNTKAAQVSRLLGYIRAVLLTRIDRVSTTRYNTIGSRCVN